ncbi:MAG: NAD(P)-dependent alcohol dehydrogenase [Pseudoclavibacter sp.]
MPEPRAGEALVRVEATAVTAADSRLRAARFPAGFAAFARPAMGFRGPRVRILGNSLSGIVERVGPGVTAFAPGDEVAGMTGSRMRTHAEFAAVPVHALAPKPAPVSHADAAGVLFGGTTALFFIRDRAKATWGETVLVNGASGAVGSAAVQLATHFGARVTAVTSARNREFALRLGAERAIDYAATPVTTLTERFDLVIDTVGNVSRTQGISLLTERGRLVLAVAGLVDTIRAGRRVIAGAAPEHADDIAFLLDLVVSGDLDPVSTVAGGLDALPDAHRLVDSARKVGNLVVLPGA